MPKKETSPHMSTLAAMILNGYEPTREEIMSMAASLLSQDETRGQGYARQENRNVKELESDEPE